MTIFIEIKNQTSAHGGSGMIHYDLYSAKTSFTWKGLEKEPFWQKGNYLQSGVLMTSTYPLLEQEAVLMVEKIAAKKYPGSDFSHKKLPVVKN